LPEISGFLGIVIARFYNDHEPPHFHVRYGERRAIVAIGLVGIAMLKDVAAVQALARAVSRFASKTA
jgi:hypothetical protein